MKKLLLVFAIASFFFSGCKKGNEIKRQNFDDTVSLKMKQTWHNTKGGYSITFDSVLFDDRDNSGATSGWAKAAFHFRDPTYNLTFFLLSPPSHIDYDTVFGHYTIYFNKLLPDPTNGDSVPSNPNDYVATLEIIQ